MTVRILAISGSLRRNSYNTRLLRAAAPLAPPGTELTLWDELRDVPPFDEDDEHGVPHAAVSGLRAAVADADALLIATPEYNGSIPGQLKNALDWLSRPYRTNPARGKPAAVLGASTGRLGAVWGQADTRKVLGALGARVLDRELLLARAQHAFATDDDRVVRDGFDHHLADLLRSLVDAAAPAAAPAA
ncbi:MAG: NADPH:quinone oxidoreductase [uncultured Thermoleophilia bacterium]|uniref:NADPH:quinone oxidoreductase n=1 Tax=uncultured Thermoleophilia bacterium TaxID=1497501 RepID=A0A6J4U5I6_9ACTN|nr:MAG: NADPH:quinone oxidoreductase [uncultured Thermoleophilia bacterium]